MSEKYVVTWDMLQMHARKLAHRLLPADKWTGIIAVSRGGLVPAALLARELGIRHVDTVCISSYDHDNQREMKCSSAPKATVKGFIVVDDLVDTGGTAKAIRDMYPKAHFVTIFAKPAGRPLVDDYVVDIPAGHLDRTAVGYGRQLRSTDRRPLSPASSKQTPGYAGRLRYFGFSRQS